MHFLTLFDDFGRKLYEEIWGLSLRKCPLENSNIKYLDIATAFTDFFPSLSLNGFEYLKVILSAAKEENGSGFEPSTVKYISTFGVSKY